MYKFLCRAFQFGMKMGNYVMPYRMPEYISGAGSIEKLPEWIKSKGLNNVLVVTDKKIISLGLADKMFAAMEEHNINYCVFDEIEPNPTDIDVEKGFEIYRKNGCETIVAFGGGSPMDCAKAIGAKAAKPGKKVSQLQGLMKVLKKTPPLFAVPTTSGTGSETTVAAVITDSETHHKASINDPMLIPEYAVLDPVLTVGLPPFITAITGMDALCHAVESYTNHTYCTDIENDLAKKAVKLIFENMLEVYHNGENIEARENMQKAALYAGRSFTRGCVGYVHAVGHTLGGLYGIPHGLAMSVILSHVMKKYGTAAEKRLAELAEYCGLEGKTSAEKAALFISKIEEMNKEMGLPTGFDMVKEEDIPKMIKWAMAEANPLYPVPQIWQEKEFRELIKDIMI